MSKDSENRSVDAERLEDGRQVESEGNHFGAESHPGSGRSEDDAFFSDDAAESTGDDYVVPAAHPDNAEKPC